MFLDHCYLECGTVHMPPNTVFKASVLSNCNMATKESYYFQHALNIFSAYSKKHPLPTAHRAINIVITDSEELTFSLRDEDGAAVTFAVVRIDRLRKLKEEDKEMAFLLVMLEELCHALYLIFDEEEVKRLVIKIAKFGGFSVDPHEWYPQFFPRAEDQI